MEPKSNKKKSPNTTNITKITPSIQKATAKWKAHQPIRKNVVIAHNPEPTTKPTTAGTNKRPNPTQPDPKKPAVTPTVDKKAPGTTGATGITGRPSAGGDKKVVGGKVKT